MVGCAVVGRTVNLETLVDFDKLMRIAKLAYSRIQYLGGLFILLSFSDTVAANHFMESKTVWGPWFSMLDVWKGQPLHFERVAWLKLMGIPLHLLESDTLALIGETFGMLLHVPKSFEVDHDLLVTRVGVLVGEVNRIKEVVSLKWKDRSFRIWVEEESDNWVPDSLGFSFGQEDPSPSSSPVAVRPSAGNGGIEKVHQVT
ncbi:hypothetical protein HanPSC8_Chr14g0596811 [Helianthus annuus]|nr:hypothetical protein HanIR_Chr14g0672861 [Helianthus annuus]KAJ0654729.1 hypothetical protein HanLR1_Chr14g0510411 [Helianthus annuus]KAJ0838607.1 hypothetical protein HanPSC8_Chr14g0596811 [Helianthus annuus]